MPIILVPTENHGNDQMSLPESPSPLKLEVGKTYWTRDGKNIVTIGVKTFLHGRPMFYAWASWAECTRLYNEDGSMIEGQQNPEDLVEEFVNGYGHEWQYPIGENLTQTRNERPNGFIKNDGDKPDYTYVEDFARELKQVFKVFNLGAKKYSRDNWKKADIGSIKKAFYRHLMDINGTDKETGLSHKVSCINNLLMWLFLENEKNEGRNND